VVAAALAHLALDVPIAAVRLEKAPRQLDGLCLGLRLEDRVATDHLLGFGERAIQRRELAAAAQPHAF